jgi:hypothetical protein
VPPRYLEVVLMRELGLKPWEIEENLSTGQLLDYVACLQGEARAQRVRDAGQGAALQGHLGVSPPG